MSLNLPDKNNQVYWDRMREWGQTHSDGCSKVPDYYLDSCIEHDFHYKYGVTLYGDEITFSQANKRFKESIQQRSKLKWFSPISWIRFAGVSIFGKSIWDRHRKRGVPVPPEIIL